MNIKLHNKFEITLRNETYTAYNTLLSSVYEKIANLSQYTSNIAIGTGLNKINFTESKLGNHLRTFPAETEEIQSDISKGTLYIVKSTTINEDDDSTFSFSELGLTDSTDFNPTIYNHVLLTDSEGNPVSITRNQGDTMQIRVTVYLELTQNSSSYFTMGNNPLLKQIMGENLNLSDNNLYVIRGENLLNEYQLSRETPDLSKAISFTSLLTQNEDQSFNINFSAEMGEGTTEEILICFADKVCMRINALEINQPLHENKSITPTNKVLEVGDNVKEILSITNDNTQSLVDNYMVVKYSDKLLDKIENIFDLPFNNSTPRYISKDGQLIAFILNNQLHLYKNSNYGVKKLNASRIETINNFKIVMFENVIVQFLTAEPYIKIFKIIEDVATEVSVDLTFYNNSSYSYNWLDVDANLMNSGNIKIGIIINNADYTPLIITLTKSSNDTYQDSITRPILTTAKKIYSIYKNNYSEPLIGFLTDTYSGGTYYFQEEFFDNDSYLRDSNEVQYQLLANTTKLSTSGKMILAQKDQSPYLYVFYYPDYTSAPTNICNCTNHFVSQDGNYVITKNLDGLYDIYNTHQEGVFTKFKKGIPDNVEQDKIKDFVFLGDLVLIISETSICGYALKNYKTRIEKLTSYDNNYSVSYSKYDLLGSKKLEGVKVELKLKFN